MPVIRVGMSARLIPLVFQLEKERCRQAAILTGLTMKKNTALKIINPILLVLIISQVVTGLSRIRFSHKTFEVIHEDVGLILAGLVIVHIILNWNKLLKYFKRLGTRWILVGIGFALVIYFLDRHNNIALTSNSADFFQFTFNPLFILYSDYDTSVHFENYRNKY